jgi:hypothetical protein
MALNVPVAICVTKIDMTPPNILEQTINMLVKVLKSPGSRYVHICIEGRGLIKRRIPVFVENAQQAVDCARFLGHPLEGASSGRYVSFPASVMAEWLMSDYVRYSWFQTLPARNYHY